MWQFLSEKNVRSTLAPDPAIPLKAFDQSGIWKRNAISGLDVLDLSVEEPCSSGSAQFRKVVRIGQLVGHDRSGGINAFSGMMGCLIFALDQIFAFFLRFKRQVIRSAAGAV